MARSNLFWTVSPFRRDVAAAIVILDSEIQDTGGRRWQLTREIDGSVHRAGHDRSGRLLRRRDGQHRAQARPVPGARRPGPAELDRARRPDGLRGALRARVAELAGRGRLPRLPRRVGDVRAAGRARAGARGRGQPVFLPPAFEIPASMWFDQERTLEAFRTGAGIPWGEHDERLYCGIVRLLPQRLPRVAGARSGSPRSTASSRSWSAARASRTSAAVTGTRRC